MRTRGAGSAIVVLLAFASLAIRGRAEDESPADRLERLGAMIDREVIDGDSRVVGIRLLDGAAIEPLSILAAFPHLEALKLEDGSRSAEDASALARLPNLRGLNLYGCGWVTDGVLEHVGRLNRLQSLNLAHTRVTSAGLAHLARLSDLRELDLDHTVVGDAGLASIAALARLRELDLAETRVSDEGLRQLAGLAELRRLSLRGNVIDGSGFEAIGRLVELRELDLVQCRVRDESLASLASLRKLEHLQLTGNRGVGDQGFASFAGCVRLRSLRLDGTAIGTTGLASLRSPTRVWTIDLTNTRVDGAALDVLTAMPALQEVELNDTFVTFQGFANFARANPKCRWLACLRHWSAADQESFRQAFGPFHRGAGTPAVPSWHAELRQEAHAQDTGSSLFDAIEWNEIAEVARVLAEGADVKRPGAFGRHHFKQDVTPLYAACAFGRNEITRQLLAAGADVHVRLADGSTALHAAAGGADLSVVEELLRRGAEVDVADRDGSTPLVRALARRDDEVALALRDAGATLPPSAALAERILQLALSDRRDSLLTAIACGASLAEADKRTEDGIAFTLVERRTSAETLVFVLERGVDPERWGGNRKLTPLLLAAAKGRDDCVTALLSAGANVEASKSGWTAAIFAARAGREDIIARLVARGASADRIDVGRYFRAIDAGDVAEIRRLVALGVPVDSRDAGGSKAEDLGQAALRVAAYAGDAPVVACLLELGADPNVPDPVNLTPLWAGIFWGRLDVVRLLLDHGARTDARDWEGRDLVAVARSQSEYQQNRDEILALVEARARQLEDERSLLERSRHR